MNLAVLEKGTYHQKLAHLERELELSGLEANGELSIPSMITTTNSKQTNQTSKCQNPTNRFAITQKNRAGN